MSITTERNSGWRKSRPDVWNLVDGTSQSVLRGTTKRIVVDDGTDIAFDLARSLNAERLVLIKSCTIDHRMSLADLSARTAGRTDEENRTAERFADTAEHRLGELASAVRATERMPPARRRAAHHAVEGELDRIEDDLLRRFGIGA